MDFETTDDVLTWIVTNDTIKNKENKHIFAYKNINNITHSDTLDYFIRETNLALENTWYFDTALSLAKMGHMILCNVPDSNDLLFFCPDLKKLSATQKIFISLFQNQLQNFENINIALYNDQQDEFSEYVINGKEISNQEKLIKTLKK